MTVASRQLPVASRGNDTPEEPPPGLRLALVFFAVVLFALPIFAHGCHTGDHDDEPAFVPPTHRAEAQP